MDIGFDIQEKYIWCISTLSRFYIKFGSGSLLRSYSFLVMKFSKFFANILKQIDSKTITNMTRGEQLTQESRPTKKKCNGIRCQSSITCDQPVRHCSSMPTPPSQRKRCNHFGNGIYIESEDATNNLNGDECIERKIDKSDLFDDFVLCKKIGKGSFGTIFLCEKNGIRYAQKRVHKCTKSFIENEIEAGKTLHHENIVKMLSYKKDENFIYLALEYIPGEDLFEMFKKRNWKPLAMEESRKLFIQIVEGIRYIHSSGFVHLDIKPENIMVVDMKMIKIIDFGLCR